MTMDMENNLRVWFQEINDESFDVVAHCKKLENILNEIPKCSDGEGSGKDYRTKSHMYVRTMASHLPHENTVFNLNDLFELSKRILPAYGVTKVDIKDEKQNFHFCKIIELLIKTEYFDVNDKDWYNGYLQTPLYHACIADEERGKTYIACPNLKCIELLLMYGADSLMKYGIKGNTVLHQFIQDTSDEKICLDVIKLFLKYGYDINTVSSMGYTLLHVACAKPSRHQLIVPLLELGIDINLKDVYGRYAFTHLYIKAHEDFRENVGVWNAVLASRLHVKWSD